MMSSRQQGMVLAALCLSSVGVCAPGCADDAPTTVLLSVEAEAAVGVVPELRLSVYGEGGLQLEGHRIPEVGAPSLPSDVVLYPSQRSGPLRLLLRAETNSRAVLGEGVGQVALVAGQQATLSIKVQAGRLPDADGDGVPDAIDGCPDEEDPLQNRPCGTLDGGPDGAADGGVDGGQDLRSDGPEPDSAKPDVLSPDVLSPDVLSPDVLSPDVRSPDVRSPDVRSPDVLSPDTFSGDAGKVHWSYRRAVTVNTAGLSGPLTGYPVAIYLTPSTFDYSHTQAGGADLRAASSAWPQTFDLPLWIERWDPSGESLVWVRVPTLDASTNVTIQLFYGNPTVSSASSESATFDKAFVSTGNVSGLTGTQVYQSFELATGHSLELTAGQALRIEAQRIVLRGPVSGGGAGHPAPVVGQAGAGAGGGQVGTGAAGGGGGHGGAGGAGGGDASDGPSPGGKAVGSTTATSIEMGSSGASGAGNGGTGGAGGGSLTLVAAEIEIRGDVDLDGDGGADGTDARGGGGGAGGGLLVLGRRVSLTSAISAVGGDGFIRAASTNADGGGGGGGGRIKVFWDSLLQNTATLLVDPGKGALGGDSPGSDGSPGTTHLAKQGYTRLNTSVGSEVVR